MTKDEKFRILIYKYPEIADFESRQILLKEVGNILNICKKLDEESLIKMGLKDFEKDIKDYFDPDWLKKERKKKIESIENNKSK